MRELPEGFIAHNGDECPFHPGAKLRMAILTIDGVVLTQPQQARYNEWRHDIHEELIGAVVGYEQNHPSAVPSI